MRRRTAGPACIVVACVVCCLATPSRAMRDAAAPPAMPVPASAGHRLDQAAFATPPDTDQCVAEYRLACYSPGQLRVAYDVDPLLNAGATGKGTTIAIVDSFGSPTIEHDLQVFDQAWGLPDPPSIETITPAGPLPPFDPSDTDMTGWAFETTLDVEYAHVMAPDASILVVATPMSETEGVAGFPEMVAAEKYVIDNGLADVISQSLGAAEQTFPSPDRLLSLRSAFVDAAQHGVTVVASAGDSGATDYETDEQTLYPYPVDSWPSTDPLVTSVGGTGLHLDAAGGRTSPDTVWNDGYGAGGGGLSTVFSRPAFQDSVRGIVGSQRGTPDVSLSAAVDGGVVVYTSYDPDKAGWGIVGGTSEAAPMFAGMVALATQQAGRRLGVINPLLYRLASRPGGGIVDVTTGDNSYGDITGYDATRGYDLASGLGTVDAAQLVPALAGTQP